MKHLRKGFGIFPGDWPSVDTLDSFYILSARCQFNSCDSILMHSRFVTINGGAIKVDMVWTLPTVVGT